MTLPIRNSESVNAFNISNQARKGYLDCSISVTTEDICDLLSNAFMIQNK